MSEKEHPYGSLVEQVHRVWTTDQGVDQWVLAEETVRFLRDRIAREIRAANRAARFGITAEQAALVAVGPFMSERETDRLSRRSCGNPRCTVHPGSLGVEVE